MKRHRRSATIGVAKLPVRAALPNLRKPQSTEKCDDFARLEDGHAAHKSRYFDGLRTDEDAPEVRVSFLKQHLHDLFEVCAQLIQCVALTVGTGEAWDPADVHPGIRVALDHCGEMFHWDLAHSGRYQKVGASSNGLPLAPVETSNECFCCTYTVRVRQVLAAQGAPTGFGSSGICERHRALDHLVPPVHAAFHDANAFSQQRLHCRGSGSSLEHGAQRRIVHAPYITRDVVVEDHPAVEHADDQEPPAVIHVA